MRHYRNLLFVLLAGTMLSGESKAVETSEITVDYLNSLTGTKVSWSTEKSSDEDYEIELGGQTFYYTYNKPDNYTKTSSRITDLSGTAVDSVVFKDIFIVASSDDSNGGAIYNTGSNESVNITADFIRNYIYSYYFNRKDGAIYNEGTIGDITGNFIGNHTTIYLNSGAVSVGGAIYNTDTIEDITGNFINNSASDAYFTIGGAIANDGGSIGNITGDFINNYTSSSSSSSYAYADALGGLFTQQVI